MTPLRAAPPSPWPQALSGSIKLFGCDVGDAGPDTGPDAGDGDGGGGGLGGALGRRATPDLLPLLRRADTERLQDGGFDALRAALHAALRPEAGGGAGGERAEAEAEADELVGLLAVLMEQVLLEQASPMRC